jgi:hypothetical protein
MRDLTKLLTRFELLGEPDGSFTYFDNNKINQELKHLLNEHSDARHPAADNRAAIIGCRMLRSGDARISGRRTVSLVVH